MAGKGVLSSMITTMGAKLRSLAFSSTSTSSSSLQHNNLEQEMSKLTKTLRRIQAKLDDSEEENHAKSHSEKLWLSELKDVAYDAEDVVEEYEYEMLRSKQLHESNSGTHDQDELANKAAEIRKRFDEITKEWKLLTLPKNAGKRKRSRLPPLVGNRETGFLVVESEVFGREEEKDMLVEWLLSEDDTTENGVSVIAVTGMGGLGKTTLAQLVYNDSRVKSYFNLRGWVCVSENFHVACLTEKILQSFTKVKVHEELDGLQHALQEKLHELDGLQHALQEKLQGKKFLLILDDVWNEEFTLWDELRKPLVSAQVGKVIVTTRNKSVARIMQTRSPLDLNCLPFDVCWSLFKKVTLGGADKCLQPHLEDVGRKIVDKCKGLPLAVKVLGGALRNKEGIDSWADILENEMWESEETNNGVLPALKISYDCMPIQLKRCFQFLCLFPKDRCLSSAEIVRLWMSQGLLPLDGDKRAEHTGINYIKRLAERSMLNLDRVYFSMHDLVHDLAQYIAQEECLCVMDDKFDIKKLQKIRHLSVNVKRHKLKNNEHLQLLKLLQAIKDLQQLKLLRTLFITNNYPAGATFITRPDKFFGVLDDLFQKLKYIRALDLSHSCITELPDSLSNLKLLRCLSIENTKIKSLPESICSLYSLQILNINHRYIDGQCDSAFLPSGIRNLTNLQRLTGFRVSYEKEHCDIGELNNLMKLGGHIVIYNVVYVNKFSNSKPPLKTKKYLDCLKLDWGTHFDWGNYLSTAIRTHFDNIQKAEQQLEYLHPHINIQSLRIHRYPGVRFVGWVGDSSFTKLTSLYLEDCRTCTKLPPLGQLPSLEYLLIHEMDSIQHVGREFCSMQMASPSSSQNKIAFPSLKRLEFSWMRNWEAWDGVEIGDFPSLQSIKIKWCYKMIKFPQLSSMSYVKEMTLGSCGVPDVPNMHSLTYLELHVTSQALSEWMSRCYFPMLQHLKLFCQVESVRLSQKQMPSLKTLEIRNSRPLRVVAGLKNLTSLHSLFITVCPNLEFEELPATLQQLKLKYCRLFKKGFEEQQGHMLNILALDVQDAKVARDPYTWRRKQSIYLR